MSLNMVAFADGSVLGIDVGWSLKRATNSACRLSWGDGGIDWEFHRFRSTVSEREEAISHAAGGRTLASVAIDGPLKNGFTTIGRYRSAERLLSRRGLRRIGKPGQSSSANGRKLNAQANLAAKCVKEHHHVENARGTVRIDRLAIIEAFPTTFLGVMVTDPDALLRPKTRSDRYYAYLANTGRLEGLLDKLLPGRCPSRPLNTITDHDDRAAMVCALTALSFAVGNFTAVGDSQDGWIILPPRHRFADWAWAQPLARTRKAKPMGAF